MRFVRSTSSAIALALTFAGAAAASAQTDSTRMQDSSRMQARSTRRIPVQKDRDYSRSNMRDRSRITTDTAAGEVVINRDSIRIDSLTSAAALDRARLDSIEARANNLDRTIAGYNDSLRAVRGEVSNAVSTFNTRTTALSDSINQLNQRWNRFQNGSLFGNSGFYMGVGAGANFTNGALKDVGYHEGLHVAVPIGFHKPGTLLGFRGELGVQTFDGRGTTQFGSTTFYNPDPKVLSAVAMLALHFPFGETKRSSFYLMGGGGAYNFRNIGVGSALDDRLNSSNTGENVTKWGATGGAGFEFHVLGPSSIFVESRFTNVFTKDARLTSSTSGDLRWVPLVAGFMLR